MPDLNQVPPSRGRSTCQYEQCTGSLAVSPNHHHLRPPESGPPLTHAVTEHDMRTQRRRAPFCPRQPFLLMEWRLSESRNGTVPLSLSFPSERGILSPRPPLRPWESSPHSALSPPPPSIICILCAKRPIYRSKCSDDDERVPHHGKIESMRREKS